MLIPYWNLLELTFVESLKLLLDIRQMISRSQKFRIDFVIITFCKVIQRSRSTIHVNFSLAILTSIGSTNNKVFKAIFVQIPNVRNGWTKSASTSNIRCFQMQVHWVWWWWCWLLAREKASPSWSNDIVNDNLTDVMIFYWWVEWCSNNKFINAIIIYVNGSKCLSESWSMMIWTTL